MEQLRHRFWLISSTSLFCLLTTASVQAQVSSDPTLGTERSVVTPNVFINGLPSDRIDNGAKRGDNLFHSFSEFNVGEGRGVYFTNPVGVLNILTRVTGDNASNIFGRVGVLGNASLFLINPNGIIFGPNARLDVRGSFLASTASSLNFVDGTQFSATNPEAPPLLVVNTPIGLQFGGNQERISFESLGTRRPNLRVQPEQTLAFIGGDITLNGASLVAPGGRIELGSVAGTGVVSLMPTGQGWSLGYENVQVFRDILLSQQAFVDSSGDGSGDIQLRGRNIKLTDGSQILANNNQGLGQGGSITAIASESIELSGSSAGGRNPSGIFAEVRPEALGAGGNLEIETGRLTITDGARAAAFTSGEGDAGDLTVRASTVELDGSSVNSSLSGLFTTAEEGSTGDGGDLRIETQQLLVRNGAQVSASTSGEGNAGNLTVQAFELVEVSGDESGLLTQVNRSALGSGGNLSITTGRLVVQNGGQVSAFTSNRGNAGSLSVEASNSVELIGRTTNGELPSGLFAGTDVASQGNGGDLTIKTRQLIVQDGAQAQVSTLGAGNAGKLTVQASESVELTGTGLIRTGSRSGELFPSSLLAVSGLEGVFTDAQGKGGSIEIDTPELLIQDGAAVTVSSTSTAIDAQGAGDINITAENITLDNQGAIAAETASGNGGNINLQNPNLLLLRRNSNISTTAGASGTGGNIAINNAQLLVAFPFENSDIKANAFLGRGGQVTIIAQSIFGLTERSLEDLQTLLETADPLQLDPARLSSSDITAISQTDPNLSGQVTINTLDVDPIQGLIALPQEIVDVSGLIAQSCPADEGSAVSQFVVTGRGGLPPNPGEVLSSNDVWQDWRFSSVDAANSSEGAVELPPVSSDEPAAIVEASRWVVNNKGEVLLIASASPLTPNIPKLASTTCNQR